MLSFNKIGVSIVKPHYPVDVTTKNYDTTEALFFGCQFITMNFQNNDIYMQNSMDGLVISPFGNRIIEHNPLIEHGLGRPQIIKLGNNKYIFYTRRMLGMKYFFGYAHFDQSLNKWERIDNITGLDHSANGFDSEMVYFPSVLEVPLFNKTYIFYSGNNFGESGLGVGVKVSN